MVEYNQNFAGRCTCKISSLKSILFAWIEAMSITFLVSENRCIMIASSSKHNDIRVLPVLYIPNYYFFNK